MRPPNLCDNFTMTAVLQLFWNICLLRDGPEAVPTQTWFLGTLIATQLAISVALLGVMYPNMESMLAVNLALVDTAVTAAVAWFALYLRGHEPRFPATLGAILGSGVLITVVSLLALGATSGVARQMVAWVLGMWGIVVVGFILHRALAARLWMGVLLSLGATVVGLTVAGALLGTMITAVLGTS